jgi:lambda repressor-like predicted transcriptional regulator
VAQLNGRPPELSPADLVMLRALRKAGYTLAALGRRFRIGVSSVKRYLRGEHKNPALVSVSPYPL